MTERNSCFLGFAAQTSVKIQTKRSTSDNPKAALRPVRTHTQGFGVSG